MGEASREDRDALERLQVEADELRRTLAEIPPELEQAEAAARVAEAKRDLALAEVAAQQNALEPLRDRVQWLAQTSGRPPARPPTTQPFPVILKAVALGVLGLLAMVALLAAFDWLRH